MKNRSVAVKTNLLQGESALQAICLKSQICFVRNSVAMPFNGFTSINDSLAIVGNWVRILQQRLNFKDVTKDANLARIAHLQFNLTPSHNRSPLYRLLRLDASPIGTIWCELMTGEHFKFSIITHSLNFAAQAEHLERLADSVAKELNYAYDPQLGYLTADFSLVGTGMRINSWLHLWGLKLDNLIDQTYNAAHAKGVSVKPSERYLSEASCIFHFKNRFTLNLPPQRILHDYKVFLLRVADQEIMARMREAYDNVDHCYELLSRIRFFCKEANLFSSEEALYFLSTYWAAYSIGIIEPLNPEAYDFITCFDEASEELIPQLLGPKQKTAARKLLPRAFHARLKRNDPELLRAIWLRQLADFSFNLNFYKRLHQPKP
jgi:hypothetical protein